MRKAFTERGGKLVGIAEMSQDRKQSKEKKRNTDTVNSTNCLHLKE